MKKEKPVKKCCGTCRNSFFHVSEATGRIIRSQCGRCTWKPNWPAVPYFLKDSMPQIAPNAAGMWPYGIWENEGVNCPVWEEQV